jgi:PAS domain S-box-containing protein
MQFQPQWRLRPVSHPINLLEPVIIVPPEHRDRNQHDLELLSSQHRLEAFFSQSPDGFFFMMLDRPTQWDDSVDKEAVLDYVFDNQHVTKVNPAMLAQYGAAEADFLGLTPKDFFAHDLETGRQLWRELFDQGRLHVETSERRLDGTSMWIEGDYSCLYDSNGKLIGHFGIQRDISDRKQAEEDLARFSSALSHAMEGVSLIDPQGHYVQVNQAYANMVGYSPEAMIGMDWQRTVHPDDLENVKLAYQHMLHEGKVDVEARGVRRDCSIFYKQLVMVTIFDSQQQMIGHYCFMKDISDRKQMEEALRESEQRLQSLLDNSTAVIYMKDMQGRYMMINHRYEELFHLDRNEVKGKTDQEIFPKEIADAFQANDRKVIAAGVALEKEEVAPQDDGLHTYLSIKFPLVDGEGRIYAVCGMSTDISDRKQAEVELQNQKQDLVRSNDELQQFAYVASHDLQEPLRMIASYLELLERRYKGQLDARADQFIAYAVDGAARMQILIEDLLKYSRVGSRGQSFERVDCAVVLQNVLRNLQVAIAENNAVITHDPLPSLNADITQLTQLFQNLIGNALKFRREDPPQIYVGVERTNGKWLFSVRDNGIGIESQYTNRIFVIFQRLHNRTEYSGTGMGLAICKKIVERHGGKLWVESKPGEGSTFYFTLPDSGDIPS